MSRQALALTVWGFLGGILLTRYFQMASTSMSTPQDSIQNEAQIDCQETIKLLQRQRDELSVAMMQLSQQYLQYQCKMKPKAISSHGGWCRNIPREKYATTDRKLVQGLIELFTGQTVGSFGEGLGVYKQLIDRSQKVTLYDGYDGAPFSEKYTDGKVHFLDLTVPVFGLKLYDWVISLEVAEHIPKEFEHIYLDNLVHHARKGLVLSWAVPGQKGHGHVNGHTFEYIVEELNKRGFSHDVAVTQILKSKAANPILKNNINVFKRRLSNLDNFELSQA